ncbi:MAG: DedA family protein [Magnetovibrio sp.]|nr:DedA family protein [Magnetovibrio sp.]
MLRRLYDWTLELAGHKHAMWALFFVAFIESSVFLVPPDVLIIPMVLAAREKAWRIAFVCTVGSVLGGIAGYGIGFFVFEEVGRPILEIYHAVEKFEAARDLYNEHGALIVFSAGFSPIPYKVFTIASGVADMNLVTFTLASLVGRGARFFLVAALLWKFGAPIKEFIERYLAQLTLAFVVLLAGGFVLIKYLW